ncbi:RNA polymerase sigma factor [Massilia solisilvae]|uniref:RNA polymerase sigma factor n=1 Tax=Massilia solisilvae TaxID=1811225 RepID=A0ABT2BMA4_9BURK|nr:RNA polymerase sigma factor [Massilia solisilvae]MCS0609210.1 RNA polymerase sigma factor [Massilia solisilvae]
MRTATNTNDDASLTDADLAARIAAGDHHAFALLMRRHNRALFRAARSILRDDGEAEDALQDAYLQAYRAIGSFRGDARLSTWLTRIVVNEAIARSRKSRRRGNITPLFPADEHGNSAVEAAMDEERTDSPEQEAMRAEARVLLERSLDALPEAFRTVFVLRAVEEMSGEEVAACLGIPEATVRSRFFRARAMLRAALASQFDLALEDAFSFDGARCDRIVAAVLARLGAS